MILINPFQCFRPDFDETESWLMSLGATMVTKESDVKSTFGGCKLYYLTDLVSGM